MKGNIFIIVVILLITHTLALLGGALLGEFTDTFSYNIKSEMQSGRSVFWCGGVKYTATKYPDIYLATIKNNKCGRCHK